MKQASILITLLLALAACEARPSVSLQAQTTSYTVQTDWDGLSLGPREVTIQVAGGSEPTQVIVATSMTTMNMSGAAVVASKVDTGKYQARGEFFTMLGDWHIEVRLKTAGGEELAGFDVTVQP